MIDFAKKFPENIVRDFNLLIYKNNDWIRFNPDSNEDFYIDLKLKIVVEIDSDLLSSDHSRQIIKKCNNNVSIVVNAQCRNTDFNHSSVSSLISPETNKYEFELEIIRGSISKDFNLSVSIFYSGQDYLSEDFYWPSISLMSELFTKTWRFENFNNPIFNVVKNPGDGLRLVTLNLNNILEILENDVEDLDYYALIDTSCVGEDVRQEKFVIASIIYEYIEFIVFKPELAENLISGFFEENSLGNNMKLFMSEFMSSEFSSRDGFSINNVMKLRSDLVHFKSIVYKYIKEILR
jgi:hypothetical protein